MPFRERLKTLFGRGEISPDNSLTTTNSAISTFSRRDKNKNKNKKDEYKDWPAHIYKPHEMPRPKYRQPPDEKHTARLQAFTWDSIQSLRRRSGVSQYSPRGSRLPSISSKTQSVGPSRNQSIAQVVAEADENEGDIVNVGLSRQTTQSSSLPRRFSLSKTLHSRPSTANGLIPELIPEQTSKEQSTVHTPFQVPFTKPKYDENDWPLTSVKTITLDQRRPTDIQNTIYRNPAMDDPFSEAELTRALTQIPIRYEAAVGA